MNKLSPSAKARLDMDRSRDAFFTSRTVAKKLVCETMLPFVEKTFGRIEHVIFVEPSAGDGAFVEALPSCCRCFALDIEPRSSGISRADFLEWVPSVDMLPMVVFGNPPFGKNSSLALKFVNRAATFAHAVAMILPRTFRKESLMVRVDAHLELVVDVDVPKDSFVFKGEPYDVPCCFMIFVRRSMKLPRKERNSLICEDFSFVSKEKADLSFQRVGVNAGCVRTEFSDRSPSSHYFLKANDGIDVEILKNRLSSVCWEPIKDSSAGNPSIPKRSLIEEYVRIKTSD